MEKMVVVITGASSGIGLAIAEYLSSKNYIVYGLSRKIPSTNTFKSLACDVTNLEEVNSSINQIISIEGKIDVLINNAGKGMVGSVEDATEEEILSLFSLNLIGCVNTLKAVMPQYRKQKTGKIINVSSIGSIMGLPFRGYYSASKSALDRITESMRYEISGFGTQACVLHLGDIQSDIAQNRINTKVSAPYTTTFDKVYASINAHVDDGVPASEVGPYIEKLILKPKLKAHYYFGKGNQKLSVLLKKILPQNIFENIIKKYSHLS